MYIKIKLAELVEWSYKGKGNNIKITMVQLYEDNGKFVKAIKLTEWVISMMKEAKIKVERDWNDVSPVTKKTTLF